MRDHRTDDDVRRHGGIDLPTLQRHINFHYSVSLDLFGSEVSTNAANAFTMGLKGRFEETKKDDDHRLADSTYPVTTLEADRVVSRDLPALTALNERLRDDYIADCQRGVDRWNRIIDEHGIDLELRLPHRGFHRAIGSFGEAKISPDGRVITQAECWPLTTSSPRPSKRLRTCEPWSRRGDARCAMSCGSRRSSRAPTTSPAS